MNDTDGTVFLLDTQWVRQVLGLALRLSCIRKAHKKESAIFRKVSTFQNCPVSSINAGAYVQLAVSTSPSHSHTRPARQFFSFKDKWPTSNLWGHCVSIFLAFLQWRLKKLTSLSQTWMTAGSQNPCKILSGSVKGWQAQLFRHCGVP